MDAKVTDAHMFRIAKFLPRWKAVLKLLGLEAQTIRDIEGGYPNPEDQRSEALSQWVQKVGAQATYSKIHGVLCDLEENDAADKVKELVPRGKVCVLNHTHTHTHTYTPMRILNITYICTCTHACTKGTGLL